MGATIEATHAGAQGQAAGAHGLLRLITCGSVDDGKSTLIGRMLYDSKGIYQDQWEAVSKTSQSRGDQQVDLALLTDGLRAEREQGITIDVAYRYFSTPTRKFILADTPGHIQYTRNMATGASTADAAIILIDARQGVVEQTRRHACVAALLGISHLIVCVNKMDLVEFDRAKFDAIAGDFARFAASARPDGAASIAERAETTFIPISALQGDNVVTRSAKTAWYAGPTLMEHLETVPARGLTEFAGSRLPVQFVIRPQSAEHHDYRGYAGQMACGTLAVGDEVIALPGGQRSRITRIHIGERDVRECFAGQSVAVLLADDLDFARGDLIVRAADMDDAGRAARVAADIEATVVWMNQQALAVGKRYVIKHTSRSVAGVVRSIEHKLDIQTQTIDANVKQLGLNEIGRVKFKLATAIAFDAYAKCRGTGAFIVIDEQTNNTVGAGLIL